MFFALAVPQWLLTSFPASLDLDAWIPNQPWQRLLFPVLGLLLAAPALNRFERFDPFIVGVATVTLASLGFYQSLPRGEGYADLVAENSYWIALVSLATAWNLWTMNRLYDSEGSKWVFAILVANMGTVAAAMLAQFASLGEWCLCLMLLLSLVAILPVIRGEATWTRPLLLPFLFLCAALVAHLRFYASSSREDWFYWLIIFMPSFACLIDLKFLRYRSTWLRVTAAALICTAISGFVIWKVWGQAEEVWSVSTMFSLALSETGGGCQSVNSSSIV